MRHNVISPNAWRSLDHYIPPLSQREPTAKSNQRRKPMIRQGNGNIVLSIGEELMIEVHANNMVYISMISYKWDKVGKDEYERVEDQIFSREMSINDFFDHLKDSLALEKYPEDEKEQFDEPR